MAPHTSLACAAGTARWCIDAPASCAHWARFVEVDSMSAGIWWRIRESMCYFALDGASILPDRVSDRSSSTTVPRPDLHRKRGPVPALTEATGGLSSATTPEEAPERVYEDRSLTCRDCSEEFVFSSGEQAFFSSKGLLNDPQRCPACRAAAKQARTAGGPREFHAAICGSCGGQAMVPFAPRNDRPVYCSSCFDKVRAGTISESATV
jgi:CxxC-x17-CxxC domain-containing protein